MSSTVQITGSHGYWRALAAWLLTAAGLLSEGCGADVVTYRDYETKSMQASCERRFRCCGQRCSTTADITFNSSLKNTEFAINTGLITFNAAQAQACLDATTSLYSYCTQYVATVDTTEASRACIGILQGALPIGAACSQTTDYCEPNSYCSLDTSLDPPQARCRRVVNVGEPCDSTTRCVTDNYCSTMLPRICTSAGALGESCTPLAPCQSSLACLNNATCGYPQEGGKPCNADTQCLSKRCAVDICTVPMTKPATVSDLICGGYGSV